MDQQTTSQCVGREFVKQYYTVLHETPLDMYRFYTDKSSYLHGGDEQAGHELSPVCGQTDIYEKFKSLNFQSCHAKIRQVDSHMSVDDSVVVQVSGELSNNGNRMRRFMQTFVLVQQSSKNYYVHNDIFRYQDQVFHNQSANPCLNSEINAATILSSSPSGTDGNSNADQFNTESYPSGNANGPVSELRGVGDLRSNCESTRVQEEEYIPANSNEFVANAPSECEPASTFEPEPIPVHARTPTPETVVVTSKPTPVVVAPVVTAPPPKRVTTPPKMMSWAARASANSANYRSNCRNIEGDKEALTPSEHRTNQVKDEAHANERVQQSRVPDNQQVFVGNVPLTSSESALKKYFERFGEVIQVKLNTKSKPNAQGLFAFVCFSNVADVTKVLQAVPLKYEGQTLNIEEKKDSSKKFGNPNSNKSSNTNKPFGTNKPANVNPAKTTKPSNANSNTKSGSRNKTRMLNQRPKNGQMIAAGGRQ